ncbi:MAG: ABC transporter substrate-binding protein [Deltaproteobacteria bacterium]|nr:ABC transporter substrate-binding protein [Deltaproteobacteria bacterium]
MEYKKDILSAFLPFAFFLFFLGDAFALPSSPIPQRIVSLVPTLTEELYLLGVGDRVVGVTIYCQRPPEAQSKQKVGTVIDVNVEKVLSLSPDLVLASPLVDHKQVEKLRDLGMRVEIFQEAKDFHGLCENFLSLSHLVAQEQRAAEIIEEAKRGLEATKKRVEGLPRPEVFVQIGANPLFTATGNSFVNEFIEFAGAINIAGDAKTGIYSREEVIRRNPDVILIVTMGIVGEQEKEVWLNYKTINAVKNRKIYTVDSYRFCSPTPLSFVVTVKELARIFHEDG